MIQNQAQRQYLQDTYFVVLMFSVPSSYSPQDSGTPQVPSSGMGVYLSGRTLTQHALGPGFDLQDQNKQTKQKPPKFKF